MAAEIPVGYRPVSYVASPLTITDSVRYQGASGDLNPMHHDTDLARLAGHKQPYAVGMLQASVLAMYLTDWLGIKNLRRYKVRFLALAWPGDVLTYSADVTAVRTDDDGVVTMAIEGCCSRQTGETHLVANATFQFAGCDALPTW